ncbi:MAG TPA: lytic transglycosylase domain-containing protein [Pyrinomonadaceae bacterium]|nr:lytic transglycosylase domain-containing protein [Pyrinomonadaceae bacterium]
MTRHAKTSCAIIFCMIIFGMALRNVNAQAMANNAAVNQSSPTNGEQQNARKLLKLTDGTTLEVDDAWEEAQGIWYRQGSVTHLIDRSRVRSVDSNSPQRSSHDQQVARVVSVDDSGSSASESAWIYLVGGARVEADEVREASDGVWYRRGSLSIFIESARIERIERESDISAAANGTHASGARGWSTGNGHIDGLIRESGARYGVDPYLIFCVMEQESHFNVHALSPKGARGLMQLMPGTSARFGVRRPFDAAQNIAGGTRYLKQLLMSFNNRVDLALASYNAGEGAVYRYGGRVPPYRETRNYVNRISARYGQSEHAETRSRAVARATHGN